jgi:hypothetical protein
MYFAGLEVQLTTSFAAQCWAGLNFRFASRAVPDSQDFHNLFISAHSVNEAIALYDDFANRGLMRSGTIRPSSGNFSNISTRPNIRSPSLSAASGLSLAMNIAISRKSSRERSVQTILKSTI